MSDDIIDLKGVNSGYGNLQIIFGVDMPVAEGKINVIIGPNGAGKSTVLKSVFNLCDIYSGSIRFEGEDIAKRPTYERIKSGISIVPQGRQVFSNLTVKENLRIGAYLVKDKEQIQKNMLHVFEHFPVLKEKLNDLASSLSGGQQQMLAIGRALMQKPRVLLLDEPSLGLSPKLMKQVFKSIQDIKSEGVTILMVEQNAKSACEIADRIFVLEEGRVALSGGPELMKSKELKHIYLGGHGHE